MGIKAVFKHLPTHIPVLAPSHYRMQKALVPIPVDGYQIETLEGEIVLFHPTRNTIIHGNQTSALIWHLCDGVRTVDEIVEILSTAYPESQNELRVDVPDAIQKLVSQGVLETK